MILLNRNISILSVIVMMTVAVMATVTVAFATPNEGGNGQPRVEVCHKGKIITVAQPAVAAHERHGDDMALCENPAGTTPELTTMATASVTLDNPISDTATLSGATSDATGTMTFKLYGPFTDPDPSTDTCVDPDPANNVAGTLETTIDITSLGSPDTSGNYVVSSGDYTPTTVGRYQWVVSYSGDANNEAVSSECKAPNEASLVTEPNPTSTTE
jgi:polyisoprenoid-binding protein YceI